MQQQILSIRTVAVSLDVSERTVRKWCEVGSLPHYRIGRQYRIRQSDLDAYLSDRYLGEKTESTASTPECH
jgi:excisionase family DNA binding protein